jgi:hypothetical protein
MTTYSLASALDFVEKHGFGENVDADSTIEAAALAYLASTESVNPDEDYYNLGTCDVCDLWIDPITDLPNGSTWDGDEVQFPDIVDDKLYGHRDCVERWQRQQEVIGQ